MVYIIPIILCLFYSIKCDQSLGTITLGDYPYSKRLYNFIFAWLVLISAFQYSVGYDIPIYMDAFDNSRLDKFSDIWGDSRYRPGWLFLQFMCHKVFDDFVLLKIIQACFLNYCVYKFLSRYSKYWYLTLFFYILYPYGQLNFGAMRQSFAVGFFLLSVQYLERQETKKDALAALLKYYVFCILATLFHTSGYILFIIPLLKYCVATRTRMSITIASVVMASIALSQISDLNSIIYTLFGSSDLVESNARWYLTSDDYTSNKSGISLLMAFIPIALIYLCLYLNRKQDDSKYHVLRMLLLMYIIMATLNLSIPIFYRFNDYFVFAYIVLIPMAIYEGTLAHSYLKGRNSILQLILFLMFILYPVNHLVAVHPSFGFPGYRIYYPYYSVFNPQIDPERNRIIDFK